MASVSRDLKIELSVEGGDAEELDDLTRELKREIETLGVESVKSVSAGSVPAGTKSADWTMIGQLAVTLAPSVIPPLIDLLKSWVERKPSTPVKIRLKAGKKTAQIEYDPTKTNAKDLELLVKSLTRSMKK
ncbi:MAG: hypothetical protein HRF47_01185 [Chloroflexota bacterium]|jgi:hypothetical protein